MICFFANLTLLTSVQPAGIGLIFPNDLSNLVFLQRRVQDLVQPGVPLRVVDEVHELVQRDKGLPLGAAEAKRQEFIKCERDAIIKPQLQHPSDMDLYGLIVVNI